MAERSRPRGRQLTLPTISSESVLPEMLLEHIRASARARSEHMRVHLHCRQCTWRGAISVEAPSRQQVRIDRMLPRVPVRHWVFSPGDAAQAELAVAPALRVRVARACVRSVFAWLRRAAARGGVPAPAQCGAVSAIHRVGMALHDDVHVHALVLDGVYTHEGSGPPVFHPVCAPRRRDLRRTVLELRHALDALLPSASRPRDGPSARARVVHRMALGPAVQSSAPGPGALGQQTGRLDVRSGPVIAPTDSITRARLCRYVAREPFDPCAVGPGDSGRVRYRLRHPFSDGTTHVELSPAAMAERLRAVVRGELRPPVAFHGVLAPRAAAPWVPTPPQQQPLLHLGPARAPPSTRSSRSALVCPRCTATMDIVGVEPGGRRAA
ncbi:MAG: transposase [Deltaproteobacteria bacterium]|nr:transposase [Deltaproteobacteria bacterium]